MPLWPGKWASDRGATKMPRHDLRAAEVAYIDEAGHVFNFHALRHQFISMLASAGIHPKTAQELARRSDINLTMKRYTHVRLSDLSAALRELPSPTLPNENQSATGTDGTKSLVAPMGATIADKRCNSVPFAETIDPLQKQATREEPEHHKYLKTQAFESECAPLSGHDTRQEARVANRIRTGDLWNHNPAL